LKICDADGQPYVIISDQAVNYRAEHYLSAASQIETQLEKACDFIQNSGEKYFRP